MADKPVYILAGQSNALGLGRLEVVPNYLPTLLDAQIIGNTVGTGTTFGQYNTTTDYASGNGHGMDNELLYRLAAHHGEDAYLIKTATGGTSLAVYWEPDSGTGWTQLMTDQTNAETDLSPDTADYQAFIWYQGEEDAATEAYANAYETNLTAFIAAVRAEFGPIPFVVVKLPDHVSYTYLSTVRAAQVAVAAADPTVLLITTDDLGVTNATHISSRGHILLGRRAYSAIIGGHTLKTPTSGAAAASDGTLTLTWDLTNAGIAPDAGILIERSLDDAAWSTLTTTAAAAVTYADTTVTNGTLYYYRLTALASRAADTDSAASSSFSGTPSAVYTMPLGVATYEMTDGSGTTVTDASGNGNHLTIAGAGITWEVGRGLTGTEGAGAIALKESASLGLSYPFTLMVDYELASAPSLGNGVFGVADSGASTAYMAEGNSSQALFTRRRVAGSQDLPTVTTPTSGSMANNGYRNKLILEFTDATTLNGWVNRNSEGEEEAEFSGSPIPFTVTNFSIPTFDEIFMLGRRLSGSSALPMDGTIYRANILDRVLTTQEITDFLEAAD